MKRRRQFLILIGMFVFLVLPGLALAGAISLGDADARYTGEARFDQAGASVAGAGDVNNDGYADLLIASSSNDAGGNNAGAVYLILGSDAPASMSLTDAIKFTGEAGARAGQGGFNGGGLAGAGDVNGDGYDDLLIGAEFNSEGGTFAGAAYLVLGSASPADMSLADAIQFTGEMAHDHTGVSVAGAGDVNNDGYADLLIGGPRNDETEEDAGAAYLILGSANPASMSLASAITFSDSAADSEEDRVGFGVAGAGDVNNDGYDDILIGAPNIGNEDVSGGAYLVLGSASPASADLGSAIKFAGESGDERAGVSVAGVGDVNSDGYDDLLIGAENNSDNGFNAGAAYLVLGSASPASSGLSTAIQFTGEAEGDFAGRRVAGAGDVNDDGYADMLIGAPENDAGGSRAGAAYLVLGSANPSSGNLSAAPRYTGEQGANLAGTSAAGAGDVNGDGVDDILIGAPNYNTGPDDEQEQFGAAYLFFGQPLGEPTALHLQQVDVLRAGTDWSVALSALTLGLTLLMGGWMLRRR